jgi:hypothetical protein
MCIYISLSNYYNAVSKNDYKLKNALPLRLSLNLDTPVSKTSNTGFLNKMVSKTYNIRLLNKMVFLLQSFIIVGYSRLFDKYFVTYNVRILDGSLEEVY